MPDFTVHHELLRRNGRIRFRKFKKDGYEHYKIRLYVEGDIPDIETVQYELHPSFRDPLRESNVARDGFAISFWTYGEFEVLVTVIFRNGNRNTETYELMYSAALPAEDEAYIDETSLNV